MSWQDRVTVKKGNFGEAIVKAHLEKNGYVLYKAVTEKSHGFDFLAVKDKKVFIIAEVKSKARLNKYDATGIDVPHLKDYMTVLEEYGLDIILFFVDEHPKEQRVYCQRLSKLMLPFEENGVKYPNFGIARGKVLFPLSKMVEVRKLTLEELNELKLHSSRNYEYE